jgi:hypothetical protein
VGVRPAVRRRSLQSPTPLDGGLGCNSVRHRLVRDRNPGVVALSLIALPAQAAGTVYIEKVYYSSPGAGDGSNCRLNAEYAVIRNGDSPHTITGWAVRDAAGHRYRFGTLRLRAGKQARMVSARKIACHEPIQNVTTQSSVVWPRAGTRQTPEISSTSPRTRSTRSECASSGRTRSAG